MPKTLTMRLDDATYETFVRAAKAERRSLANLVETAALRHVRETSFVDDSEMAEIIFATRTRKTLEGWFPRCQEAQGADRHRPIESSRPGNSCVISRDSEVWPKGDWKPSCVSMFIPHFAETLTSVRTSSV